MARHACCIRPGCNRAPSQKLGTDSSYLGKGGGCPSRPPRDFPVAAAPPRMVKASPLSLKVDTSGTRDPRACGPRSDADFPASGLQLMVPRTHLHPLYRRIPMKLTPGKLAGLKRVSNERGVIAA